MVKIVGFKHSQGEFTANDGRVINYNNVLLYYMFDNSKNVVGIAVGEFKIAFDKCKEITGFDYSTLPELLNKPVQLVTIPVKNGLQLDSIIILPGKAETEPKKP